MIKIKFILINALLGCLIMSCGEKSSQDNAEQTPTQEVQQPQQTVVEQPTPQATTPAPVEQPVSTTKQPQKPAPTPPQSSIQPAPSTPTGTMKPIKSVKSVDEQVSNPGKFIRVSNVSFASRGLTSSNIDLNFSITNNSTKKYRDVVLRVEYYDENAALLTSKNIKCEEVINPGAQTLTKITEKVKGTETVKMKYVSAKLAN